MERRHTHVRQVLKAYFSKTKQAQARASQQSDSDQPGSSDYSDPPMNEFNMDIALDDMPVSG